MAPLTGTQVKLSSLEKLRAILLPPSTEPQKISATEGKLRIEAEKPDIIYGTNTSRIYQKIEVSFDGKNILSLDSVRIPDSEPKSFDYAITSNLSGQTHEDTTNTYIPDTIYLKYTEPDSYMHVRIN
jgi:hypothetical protein